MNTTLNHIKSRGRGERGPDRKPRKRRVDADFGQSYLAAYRAANPDYAKRWLSAMMAARRSLPTCDYVRKTGERCKNIPVRGSCRCAFHISSKERERLDIVAMDRHMLTLSRTKSPSIRIRTEARIRAILRRQLFIRWRSNPEEQGSTLALSESDERIIRDWLLRECGVNLDRDDHTPRFIDAVRWAALRCVNQEISVSAAHKRVLVATRQEMKWRNMRSTAEMS